MHWSSVMLLCCVDEAREVAECSVVHETARAQHDDGNTAAFGNPAVRDLTSYPYSDALHHAHHHYLDGEVLSVLEQLSWPAGERRVFELGCGNGSFAKLMSDQGYTVTAIDTSIDGIKLARISFPGIAFHNGSAYDDLSKQFGKFN